MVLHEIRDTLTLSDPIINSIGEPGNNQVIIYQKKITLDNLNYGSKHTMNQVDIFIDQLIVSEDTETNIFLSNFPINAIADDYGVAGAYVSTTPAAADWILYKSIDYLSPVYHEEFPASALGASTTFEFYTPEIWMTVVVFNTDTANPTPIRLSELCISYYVAVDSTAVDHVEYGIGILRENRQYNLGVLESNGSIGLQFNSALAIPPNRANSHSSIRFGGIRPELMVSGEALTNFWLDGFNQEASNMLNFGQMRADIRQSNQMVAWNAAFGDTTVVQDNLPDWLNMNTGLNLTGAIKSQFPALKYADNGNVLFL